MGQCGWGALLAMALLSSCSTWPQALEDRNADAATLEKSMATIHDSTVSILATVNEDLLPYRVIAASRATRFDPKALYVLRPQDIDTWDKLLAAMDLYCSGLSKLASGSTANDFSTAAESLGGKLKDLASAVKTKTNGAELDAATAVTALGNLLIRYKANGDLHQVVSEAKPQFDLVLDKLISALGFAGSPPAPAGYGILATFDDVFGAYNSAASAEYRDDTIAGFAGMTPSVRQSSIEGYLAWKKALADHDSEDARIKALVAALTKAEKAHAALAGADPQTLKTVFAELETEVKAVQQIQQKL